MPAGGVRASFPDRGARALTAVYAFSTVVALVTWLLGHWGNPGPNWLELLVTLVNVPLSHSVASIALLALISRALLGRKRIALVVVAVTQVFGMYLGLAVLTSWPTSPLLRGWRHEHALYAWLDIAALPLGAVILVFLWKIRTAFSGRVRPGSWWRALTVAALGLATTALVTAGVLSLVAPPRVVRSPDVFLAVLTRALGETGRDLREDLAVVPSWVPSITAALLTLTMLASVTVFLRYAKDVTRWSPQREARIRRLIRLFGDADSLAYFATRRDKSSVFSPDGRAVVTYQVSSGVSVASGDPIGDPASWPAAVRAWKEDAIRYGWIPAVLAASSTGARCYAREGLSVTALGDEAVLETRTFSLAGREMAAVRRSAQHARRAGLTVHIAYQEDLDDADLDRLRSAADHWRHGDTERGFSMALNRFADRSDPRVLFVMARDAGEGLVGVLSFVPWGTAGLSLDTMRRSPSAPQGVTEFMVSELMAAAPSLGVARVSLNFCLFRRVYEQAEDFGASTFTRLNSSFLGVLDRFWQLGRLYRANRQYHPRWDPRFVCYDDRVGLPQILVALGSVEGFLPRLGLTRPAASHLTPAELAQVLAADDEPLPQPTGTERRLPEQLRIRREHLAALARRPVPPYTPGRLTGVLTVPESIQAGGGDGAESITVSGRMRAVRDHGRVVFADLVGGGASLQLLLGPDHLPPDEIRAFRRLADPGDIVAVAGRRGRSRNGTPSLLVEKWVVLAKALHPVPFSGLTDPQSRARRRSTDLIVNPAEIGPIRQRGAVLRALRRTLDDRGFLEVETPILQPVHGGASARPFRTRINAYQTDLYLRIAPELYLKRLVVAGLGPIYEIGRNFRNEGADATHNPEFTSLEAYQPGADYTVMRELTEDAIRSAAAAVVHAPGTRGWAPPPGPWPAITVLDAVSRAVGQPVSPTTDIALLRDLARRHHIRLTARTDGPGAVLEALYAALVEPATTEPTFYVDFPQETSPLAAAHRITEGLAERWDLVIDGMEVATGYSELTDPVEQRRRLTLQSVRAAAGDPEAMELDEDFLYALETGMPPTGGVGIGVDRLLMVLTGHTIRSTLTFPFVKPIETASTTRTLRN